MKRFPSFLVVFILLIGACNNNKSKDSVTVTSKDGDETVTIDPKQMQNAAEDMVKMKDELGKLTPLNTDQLKALLPEQLMGAARSDMNVASAMGASTAEAKYEINDSTDIRLNIIDCAGPGGAGIYSMQYLGMFNFQEENEDEYTKTIDFNGGKGFENCKKTRSECTLTYFSGGRFLVSLEGNNVGIDALKSAAKGMNIK
ncbi:MAG: hypothetical protein IPP43_08120 [Chitinophagaceae bacterium]|nr:hypothetical protein [Chitinophagaceae bacterium]MBL0131089.1 hypothetical protein [Chitinophagaceae bacterium]MBL0272608.1 hypothetical protein [Chitinophagaceae bacterium]